MSEGLFLFTPLDASADLRAETVGAPISPLDEVRVFRPGTEGEGAEGETGELAARGPYTIRGYLDAPDRDREAFTAEGFYRSGDLVRARRYQGALSYSIEGRVKNLIDRGGEKINAEEVELLVAGHPAVAEMAPVGMPDPRLGERGCAYVVVRDPQNPPTGPSRTEVVSRGLSSEGPAAKPWLSTGTQIFGTYLTCMTSLPLTHLPGYQSGTATSILRPVRLGHRANGYGHELP